MSKYYLVKENIDLKVLKNYGYREELNGDYTKWEKTADESEIQFIRISRHTKRIFFERLSLFKDEYWIKDLLKDNLLEEKDAILGGIIDDPDEFEDDVVIGLGKEMMEGH